MKKTNKVKFGGGVIKLGSAVINHFSDWSQTGDAITLRELRKGYNRITKRGANLIGFKTDDVLTNDNNAYMLPTGELVSSDYEHDKSLITGDYKLYYNGKTTRKIKHYLDTQDLQNIIDEDIGSNTFNVSVLGNETNYPSYGPYLFESTSNGSIDYIQIKNQNDINKISGHITGFKGDASNKSIQSLTFSIPATEASLNLQYSNLEAENEYCVAANFLSKDLDINNPTRSGISYTKIPKGTTSASYNYSTPENNIHRPWSLYLYKLKRIVTPLIKDGRPDDQDEQIYLTGFKTGYHAQLIDRKHFSKYPSIIDAGEGNYTNEYSFAGAPNYFTGSNYLGFEEIKITGSSTFSGFVIPSENNGCTLNTKNIDLRNNSNLKHFKAYRLDLVTGVNLSGCSITGHNNWVAKFPSDLSEEMYTPDFYAPNLKSLNFYGNGLDATGLFLAVEQAWLSDYSGQSPNGYLNIKNQSSLTKLDSTSSGRISELSGRNWIVEYD